MSERSDKSLLNLHGLVQSPKPNTCQECTQLFHSNAELEGHAKSLHYNAFECKCGKLYARFDNLKRHWKETPKFPCPHYNKYTRINAFAREDHLTQLFQATIVSTIRGTKMIPSSRSSAIGPTIPIFLGPRVNTLATFVPSTTILHFCALYKLL